MYKVLLLGSLVIWLLTACTPAPATQALIQVNIKADGKSIPVQLSAGSTVQQALDAASLSLGTLDRVEPPAYTVLSEDATVNLIRVTEKFEVVQEVIPFEHQTLLNESLPQGREHEVYLQKGENGLKEVTYRRVYENGVEVPGKPVEFKEVILKEPVPEIVMTGVQTPFYPVATPGKLLYLRDGRAWLVEQTTGNRRAVVTTGDLDGRVFSLSADGNWLLFTRRSKEEGEINSLWVKDISSDNSKMIDLKVYNVVHFADWVPGSNSKIVFSTVEPRAAAPGWQANNDLYVLSFSPNGWTTKWKDKPVLEANSGGIYGWWGMSFAWAPNGQELAFMRADRIGLVNFSDGTQTTIMDTLPFQTRGDWAWVPGVAWGPDGKVLYVVNHTAPQGAVSPEESQDFDLTAIQLQAGVHLDLASKTGMFAYPITSPPQPQATGETAYQVAFLQAFDPSHSDTSRYRLMVMDRDGSNLRELYPTSERSGGLEPQVDWGAWSPAPMPGSGNYAIAMLYQGNLWLVDTVTGKIQQITADGLTTRVIWK